MTAPSDGGLPAAAAGQGAELAFTYQGDALKKRVNPCGVSWQRHGAAL